MDNKQAAFNRVIARQNQEYFLSQKYTPTTTSKYFLSLKSNYLVQTTNKQNIGVDNEGSERLFQRRSSSPDPTKVSRRLSLNQDSASTKKQSVIVIKKELINRQSSISRSPSELAEQFPYYSPFDTYSHNTKIDIQNSLSNHQPIRGNNIIVRKSIGQAKRAHLNENYFESNFSLSTGNHVSGPSSSGFMNQIPTRNQDHSQHLFKSMIDQKQASIITMNHGYQNAYTLETTNKGSSSQQYPVQKFKRTSPISANTHSIEVQKNKFVRLQTYNDSSTSKKRKLSSEGSIASSDDADFERQSSQNGHSSFNLKVKKEGGNQKKFIISKDKVNFKQSHSSQKNKMVQRVTNLELSTYNIIDPFNMQHDFLFQIAKNSKSPESDVGGHMRRQKSDNLLNWKSSALTHDRSQNYLSLHVKNQIDMPRVVKAMPEAFKNQTIFSPTAGVVSEMRMMTEEEKQDENNLFQVRRANSYQRYTQKVINTHQIQSSPKKKQILTTHTLKKVSTKQANEKVEDIPEEEKAKENHVIQDKPRVSQSLLLDNFLVRRKDFNLSERQKNFNGNMSITQSKSSENLKMDQAKKEFNPFQVLDIQNSNGRLEYSNINTSGRKSTVNTQLHNLIEDQRNKTPVRVSQYLVDIEFIKAKASQHISSDRHRIETNDVTIPGNTNTPSSSNQEEGINHGLHLMSASTSSSKPQISLVNANTTEKFKEIIDNLFVPTASAFKKKIKEKEFRRPTQNPIRKSKSLTKGTTADTKKGIETILQRNLKNSVQSKLNF